MKYTIAFLFLTVSSRALGQTKTIDNDTAKASQPLVTAAPLLGGVTLSYLFTPIKADAGDFTMHQLILDESSPVYKKMQTKHPVIIKVGVRYQGLYLEGEKSIGVTNFHAISIPILATYVFSRNTNITGIIMGGIASDFRAAINESDIFYTAGVRLGFRQAKRFRFGVSFLYTDSYSGKTFLPLPDVDWTISKRWKLEGLLPVRTSLKYKLSEKHTLALTQGLNSASFRLNDASGIGKYLQIQQVSSGLMYEAKINRHWTFNLIAGYAFSQKLQVFNNDQKISFNDLGGMKNRTAEISYEKSAPMVQAGVTFKF